LPDRLGRNIIAETDMVRAGKQATVKDEFPTGHDEQ
jgi:hypothetical protein